VRAARVLGGITAITPEDCMIIVTTVGITPEALDCLIQHVEAAGLRAHVSRGEQRTIVGCIGEEGTLSEHGLTQLEGVDRVMPVLKP